MKPEVILQQNEKMLLEVQPEKAYVYFGAIKVIRRIIVYTIVIIIVSLYYNHGKKAINVNEIWTFLTHQAFFNHIIIILFFAFILIVIVSFYWASLVYQNSWYFFTDKRIIIYFGVLNINKDTYTYNRINDVDFRQYYLQRYFSLAIVILRTQGFSRPYVIVGLSKSNAEKVYQIVSEHLAK
jgi:membrane protein YdbS with pleckstrin-like domain